MAAIDWVTGQSHSHLKRGKRGDGSVCSQSCVRAGSKRGGTAVAQFERSRPLSWALKSCLREAGGSSPKRTLLLCSSDPVTRTRDGKVCRSWGAPQNRASKTGEEPEDQKSLTKHHTDYQICSTYVCRPTMSRSSTYDGTKRHNQPVRHQPKLDLDGLYKSKLQDSMLIFRLCWRCMINILFKTMDKQAIKVEGISQIFHND